MRRLLRSIPILMGEGVFCGKAPVEMKAFHSLLRSRQPEEVLSTGESCAEVAELVALEDMLTVILAVV